MTINELIKILQDEATAGGSRPVIFKVGGPEGTVMEFDEVEDDQDDEYCKILLTGWNKYYTPPGNSNAGKEKEAGA